MVHNPRISTAERRQEALHEALFVMVDERTGYVLVWKGSSAINAFDGNTFEQVGHWNIEMNDRAKLHAKVNVVRVNMQEHIDEGRYPA